MKTALQQAIENINKRVEELNNMDDVNNLWKSSCAAELLTQREYLTSLLPTEKEQIMTAYAEGSLNKTENILNNKPKITAETYYNKTFNTPTNENSN